MRSLHAAATGALTACVGLATALAAAACWAPAPIDSEVVVEMRKNVERLERTAIGEPSPSVDVDSLRRVAIHVGKLGGKNALLAAELPAAVVDELDAAFIGRIDLFAHLTPGTDAVLWLDGDDVIAARVPIGKHATLFAARYDGDLAPPGFYDDRGDAMTSALRARPVGLSRITSGFGERFDAFTGQRSVHHGIDYGVPIGTPVVAVAHGIVRHAGHDNEAGNYVNLVHDGGFSSLYLHLSRFADGIADGAVVDEGEEIGESGNTGRSTGPHLHYELHVDGEAVDPTRTLPLPSVSLGPRARAEHLAFMKQLEAIE